MDKTELDCEIIFDRDLDIVDIESLDEAPVYIPKGMELCPLSPVCRRFGDFSDCRSAEPALLQLSLFFEYSRSTDRGTQYVFSPYYHPDLFVVFTGDGVSVEWFDGRSETIESPEELIDILSRRQNA